MSFCLNKRDEKSFYPYNINEKQISLTYALMRERYITCTNINEKQISLTNILMEDRYLLHMY
jgi:hypothetical protein